MEFVSNVYAHHSPLIMSAVFVLCCDFVGPFRSRSFKVLSRIYGVQNMERSACIAFSAVSFSNNNNEFQFATNSVVCLLFIWQLLHFAVVNSLGAFLFVVVPNGIHGLPTMCIMTI